MQGAFTPMGLELQALADQIKARMRAPTPRERFAGPLQPVIAQATSAYRCCSLCGSDEHRDGKCYGGVL